MSLRDELLSAGKVELSSTFSLAMDKAREKMEKFQLPDPRYYVLQLMQAVIASGATKVRVEHKGDLTGYSLALFFDGPGYQRDELERLYDFLFESGRNRARDRTRELALGVVSAQALKPQEIVLSSNGAVWTRERNRPPRLEDQAVPDTHHSFSLRGSGTAQELKILETHCQHCDVELRINDRLISSGKDLSGAVPWPNYRFTRGEFTGALGLGYGDLVQSSLFLLRYGVQFTRRWEPRLQPAVVLICDHPGLRKNASQSDVVEDEHYLAFVEQLQQVLLDFALDLSRQRIPPYHREVVQKFLVQFFGDWFSAPMLSTREELLPDELRKLMQVTLFADLKGRLRSLGELVEAYRQDGFLALAKRRMPYARQAGLLVLVPTPDELDVLTRLFENVRYVDEILAGSNHPSPNLAQPQQPARLLAQRPLPKGIVGIPDAYPRRQCSWFYKPAGDGAHWQSGTFDHCGLSAEVRFDLPAPPEQRETTARILLEQEAPHLYEHLLERLQQANRKPEHMTAIFRAREHLLSWWRHLVERSLEGSHTEDVATRAREALGEAAWAARIFDTRGGKAASLADMATWLGTFESLTVAFGGPRFQDDHALEASPDAVEFLALVFGTERLTRATLRSNELHLRQQQVDLAGAADAGPLERRHVETEEEELQRLREEVTAPVLAPEPEPLEADPLPVVELPPESPLERVGTVFVNLTKLVFHAFTQGGLSGTLCVARPTRSTRDAVRRVHLFQGEEELWSGPLFELPVAGWLELAPDEERGPGTLPLRPEHQEILRGHLHHLFERLAVLMGTTLSAHRDFPLMRQALVDVMVWDPERTRERLRVSDLLVDLRFLPASGGTLASLASFFQVVRGLGYLEVIAAGDADPLRDHPVAVVDDLVPASFYRALFRCDTRVAESRRTLAPPERLLGRLRKELRQLRGRGDFMLSDAMLANLYWGAPGNYFIQHDAETGATMLNPRHGVVKRVLGRMDRDPKLVPVLASSVYTAINRALEEVEDRHELAFLEALLESHP